MTRAVTCGVIITDGVRLLLGHATATPRWDIPKGLADPDETWPDAAVRELLEETGLTTPVATLTNLGLHRYRPAKDLALFLWRPPTLPDPATLHCSSTFTRNGRTLPEFDRFALVPWPDVPTMVGRDMRRILESVSSRISGNPS